MSPVEFEPALPASERPQIHGLDRTATGTGCIVSRSRLTSLLVGLNSQLDAPSNLSPGKKPLVPTEHEGKWALESV